MFKQYISGLLLGLAIITVHGACAENRPEVTIRPYVAKTDKMFLRKLLTKIFQFTEETYGYVDLKGEVQHSEESMIFLGNLWTQSHFYIVSPYEDEVDGEDTMGIEEFLRDDKKLLRDSFVIVTPTGLKGLLVCNKQPFCPDDMVDDDYDEDACCDEDYKDNVSSSPKDKSENKTEFYSLNLNIIADPKITSTDEGIFVFQKAITQLINLKKQDSNLCGFVCTPYLEWEEPIGSILEGLGFLTQSWVVPQCGGGCFFYLPFNEKFAGGVNEMMNQYLV